tara:strand:+ start:92 stop:232 length:141 start_codon:yes stop_codon:yes gene_type:complete
MNYITKNKKNILTHLLKKWAKKKYEESVSGELSDSQKAHVEAKLSF